MVTTGFATHASPQATGLAPWSPTLARTGFVLALFVAIAAGFLWTGGEATAKAVSTAGADLTRLLRAMAVLKASMAVCAAAAVLWRLGAAASPSRFIAYAVSCCATAAGPGLIWGMEHVGTGALFLHGGLAATIVMLWRDPRVALLLAEMVRARSGPGGPAQRR